MNILVTGSSGFISPLLDPALAAKGHCVCWTRQASGAGVRRLLRFVYAHILDDGPWKTPYGMPRWSSISPRSTKTSAYPKACTTSQRRRNRDTAPHTQPQPDTQLRLLQQRCVYGDAHIDRRSTGTGTRVALWQIKTARRAGVQQWIAQERAAKPHRQTTVVSGPYNCEYVPVDSICRKAAVYWRRRW